MQTSQNHQGSGGCVHRLYHQTASQMSPYNCLPHYQNPGDHQNECPSKANQQGAEIGSSEACSIVDGYFTLDSFPAMNDISDFVYDSQYGPSTSSNKSASFSPLQGGDQSYVSDPHQFSDNTTYGSPLSGSSAVESNNGNELRNKMKEMEQLLGRDYAGMMMTDQQADNSFCSFRMGVHGHDEASSSSWWNEMKELIPRLDLVAVLCKCAEVVADKDLQRAAYLMDLLGQMVSVSGTPIQRLAAYMLEGLRARLEASGYNIYKTLKCEPPTGKQLLSYMHILYIICPYYKFAYMSSNAIIREAMQEERRIHIIDFQVAMGSQWINLIQDFSKRPGGPPSIRVTGVDDANSAFAREGGLEIVGKRLAKEANQCGVPFEFHAAAMSGCEVQRENLGVRGGEAVAVNFPYMLHHMPDESVSTNNHRDRLLRLVKSLSPKVVVLVEQESNTNSPPFHVRFRETLEYYTAMFESIDVARPREEEQRIRAEQHCLARDIVNMIACEGEERVERHELLGKWKVRLGMAGFKPHAVSCDVERVIRNMLKEYHGNYRLTRKGGCLYLGWKEKNLATCSAWF
uniref:GRAS8 n=1 Tax=Tamarix hispida TaxID=189793 RepID=A0A2S1WLM1_9CARY|nr:GRAS8 [Tamarix hispida]